MNTKILENIIDQSQLTSNLSKVSYARESWMLNIINHYILSTISVWKSMYNTHIHPLKKNDNLDVINKSKTYLTHYVDYVSQIRNFQIKLPDWFLLSNGSNLQKIIPCYDMYLDMLPLALIDTLFNKGKTMILAHMCNTMTRSGMHVSDVVSRNLFKAFSNPYCLSYIRTYATSPESCFMIRDHYDAYYEHIKYSLLEKKLTRMILLSSRQVLIIIDMLNVVKSKLVEELLLIDLERANECREILFNKKNVLMKGIFKKLWPDLNVIVLLKDGGYRLHTERIKQYINDIKLYSPIFFLPEITIGYNFNIDSNTYIIDSRKGYFEFIKVTINDATISNTSTENIRNLEIGDLYNIVISTTTSGFHRYITGEIIRIIGYYNEVPEIELVCHESDLLIFKSNKNNETIILTPDVIEKILLREFNIVDYCYNYKNLTQKINLYIELEEFEYDHEHNDVKQHIKNIDIVNALLDEIMLDANIRIIKSGTFDRLYKCRYSEYIDPALIQIPRLCVESYDLDILRENIVFMYK